MSNGPLDGIKVVDVSGAVAGPWASSQLAEQGADVIMIEKVGVADVMRLTGPVVGDQSGSWVSIHRNKRSIDLDIRSEAGKAILLQLVDDADVFVQNFRPGVAERLGIGYDDLSARNSELIYLSVSGFGQDGPYSEQPVYDPIIQALSGMTEAQNGDYVKAVVVDKTTAMVGAQAILSALVARGRGAGGQHVTVNLMDTMMWWMWMECYWNESVPDVEPTPTYSDWYSPYSTSDGQIAANWTNFKQYKSACEALGRPELADDPRFATRDARIKNGQAQRDEFGAILKNFTRDEAIRVLTEHDVPCAPVLARSEVFDDPQVQHNGSVVEQEHPVAGRTRTIRPPARYSKTPTSLHRQAPQKSEHTSEVLAELGFDASAITELRDGGIIG